MTVDQFISNACKLTDKSNGVWGAAYAERFLPWESLLGADGHQVNVTSPETVNAYEALGRGFTEGCAPSVNTLDPWGEGEDFLLQGKLAMVLNGFQDTAKYDKAGINYGFTALPTPPGVEPYFDVWTDGVGVLASTDNPDEAKLFIAFLTTEGQTLRAEQGNVPLNAAVAEETNWAEGLPGREEGLEVGEHSRGAVFVPNRWDVIGPLYDAWGLITSGEKSAQQALSDAAPAMQGNLDQAWEAWEEQAS